MARAIVNGKEFDVGVTIIEESDGHTVITTEQPSQFRRALGRGISRLKIHSTTAKGSDLFYQRKYPEANTRNRYLEFPAPLPQRVGSYQVTTWRAAKISDDGSMLHIHETTSYSRRPTRLRYKRG